MPRYSNRPSNEEIRQLVKEHPEYRSSSKLADYLWVSINTTRRCLLDAGIQPMTNREAQLARHYGSERITVPTIEELRTLIDKHPEYRSSRTLGKHLGISEVAARTYLLDAGIQPMTNREAQLAKVHGVEKVSIPSVEELKKLVKEHPDYRSPIELSKHLGISNTAARNYLLSAGIQPMNRSETNFLRAGKSDVKIPTRRELKKLIEEHPEYRSSKALGAYLGVGKNTTRRRLLDAGIQPMSLKEVHFLLAGKLDVKIPTKEELRELVEKNPECRSPTVLSIHLGVSRSSARKYLLNAGIQPLHKNQKLTEQNFPQEVEKNPLLRTAIEMYGDKSREVADIIAILIYPGQIDRDEAYTLVTRPVLSKYMGSFLRPGSPPSPQDIRPLVENTELDKDQVLRGIFLRSGIRYYDSLLGPKPSDRDEQDVIDVIEKDMIKEENPSMKQLLQDLLKDYKELYDFRPSGMADRIRKPDVNGW